MELRVEEYNVETNQIVLFYFHYFYFRPFILSTLYVPSVVTLFIQKVLIR